VAAYAALHPENVAAIILTAPGPPPAATRPMPAPDPATRLDAGQLASLYADALLPRRLFTYLLATADPAVAHTIAGDREMDAGFGVLYGHERPAMFCDGSRAEEAGTQGVGFYSNVAGQSGGDAGVSVAQLRAVRAPVLIIAPTCDYVPDVVAEEYTRLFPVARLVTMTGGHLVYLENPDDWGAAVRGFLAS
jgi:pimeloyl-ACP methyl ester carboxylesterase